MSEEYVVRYGSPTLAGIKTGSLFMCPADSAKEIIGQIQGFNRALLSKGLCMVPMRFNNGSVLLYMFRPVKLKKDLENPLAKRILKNAGYKKNTHMGCLAELIEKLKRGGEFPHEIGLFLGYPPEDVEGFIANKAENYKMVGSWKVYGDAESAKKKFALYDKCTRIYCERIRQGISLNDLTVTI